jgi:hypothetical protein
MFKPDLGSESSTISHHSRRYPPLTSNRHTLNFLLQPATSTTLVTRARGYVFGRASLKLRKQRLYEKTGTIALEYDIVGT